MTRAEVEAKIAQCDSAIEAILLGQSYSLDTGHGRMSVTRASLGQVREYRSELERRLSRLSDPYVYSAEVRR